MYEFPGYVDYMSFQLQTRATMTDICRAAKLTKVDGGMGPFDLVADAAEQFLLDPVRGLDVTTNSIEAEYKMIHTKVSDREADPEEAATWDKSSNLAQRYDDLHYLGMQIINAAIAQCLDTLAGTEFSPSETPWTNTVEARSQFLQIVLCRAKESWITGTNSHDELDNDVAICDNPNFDYGQQLDSSIGDVRVAIIAPGSGMDPVQCKLETRNLDNNGLQEALSYVWGPAPAKHMILVNGKEFNVRESLYYALRGLRRPDTPREIWADALCINQADNKEKVGQIKIMRHIYASSAKTTIWLGDDETEIEEDFPIEDMEKPLTEWLHESATDENNLTSMLVLCRKLTSELPPGLKTNARGRLTGKEGEDAARNYRYLHQTSILHNVSPVSTSVADSARDFISLAMPGLALPMSHWFCAYEEPFILRKDLPSSSEDPIYAAHADYHLRKMLRFFDSGHTPLGSMLEPHFEDLGRQPDGYLWAGKLMAATAFLFRCVRSVLSHKWWERMWVLQESYLPRSSPEFYFHGVHFSWDDLAEAKDIARDMEFALKWDHFISLKEELDALSDGTKRFFHDCFVFSGRSRYYEAKSEWHFKLRERKVDDDNLPCWRTERLVDVLQETASYRATNPLDKIFALEGLVDPITALLLNVDYERPLFEVFRRVTAQAVTNSRDFGCLAKVFDLLKDSKKPGEARQSWPSWVLDFTYSDAAQHKVEDETIFDPTFEGALFSTAEAIGTEWVYGSVTIPVPGSIFLTPKVLHCFGVCIPTGDAFSIKLMALFADDDDRQWHGFRNVFREDFKAFLNPYLATPYLGGDRDFDLHVTDGNPAARSRYAKAQTPEIRPRRPTSLPVPVTEDGKDSSETSSHTCDSVPDELADKWMRGLRELWSLGYNREEGAVWALSNPNLPPIVPLSKRGWACVGKHAIFLESGLVALSRTSHMEGDVLALLGGTGVFLHLRPVVREGGDPQYRIVSRALVADTLKGKVEAVLERESAYTRYFEIV